MAALRLLIAGFPHATLPGFYHSFLLSPLTLPIPCCIPCPAPREHDTGAPTFIPLPAAPHTIPRTATTDAFYFRQRPLTRFWTGRWAPPHLLAPHLSVNIQYTAPGCLGGFTLRIHTHSFIRWASRAYTRTLAARTRGHAATNNR